MSGPVEFLSVFALLMIVILGAVLVASVAFYVFNAVGLYQLSKNRGYQSPWLAWIPVANAWVLGGIADNIQYCRGKNTRYRLALVLAEGGMAAISLFYQLLLLLDGFTLGSISSLDGPYGLYQSGMGALWIFSLLIQVVSLGVMVLRCICCYQIYQDYSPKNAVLFTVLTALFGLHPFFLFAIRNKPSASLYWRGQPFNGRSF